MADVAEIELICGRLLSEKAKSREASAAEFPCLDSLGLSFPSCRNCVHSFPYYCSWKSRLHSHTWFLLETHFLKPSDLSEGSEAASLRVEFGS